MDAHVPQCTGVGRLNRPVSGLPIVLLPLAADEDALDACLAALEAYQATGEGELGQIARDTFSYVLRDMTAAEGGFYSAEDADSEGEEGRFYVFTPHDVEAVLGRRRDRVRADVRAHRGSRAWRESHDSPPSTSTASSTSSTGTSRWSW